MVVVSILDLREAPPSPGQLNSADSGLSSLDVAKATPPSAIPLSARADLPWERAISRKASITEAKKQFHELFRKAKNGQRIIITKWGKPVAELMKVKRS